MTKNTPYGIEALDQEVRESKAENDKMQNELNKQFKITFSTPTGKKVLEHLIKCTIDQPAWIPGNTNCDGKSAEQHAFMREGQNSIVREIINRVKTAKEG